MNEDASGQASLSEHFEHNEEERVRDDGTDGATQSTSVAEAGDRSLLTLLQQVGGAAALLGGLSYAIVRVALVAFYDPFGLTPEDVGWNATRALTTFAVPVALWFLLVTFGIPFTYVAATDRIPDVSRKLIGRLALLGFVGVTAVVIFFARQGAASLQAGDFVAPRFGDAFPVTAPCVRPSWMKDAAPPTIRLPGDAAFLGQSQGVTVLYDDTSSRTLRIPSASIVMQNC